MSTGAHFVDALTDDYNRPIDDAGRTFPTPKETRTVHMTANGPVIIKRQPAGDWACDACRTQGAGWLQIEAHNKRTGHKVYTELRPPR